jgi:hypothetical protein
VEEPGLTPGQDRPDSAKPGAHGDKAMRWGLFLVGLPWFVLLLIWWLLR